MARSKELSQFAPLVTVLSGTTTLDSNYSISGNLTVNSNTISLGTEGATISYNSGTNLIELNTGLVVDSISIGGAGASGSFDTGSISYAANTITGYNTNEDISITANGTGRIVINNDLTLTGTTLRAPATFTIDPAAHSDDTGTVVIKGNLQVDGTTTTINSTTLVIDDKNIVVASGAADAAAANGAGITVDGANATFTYTSTNDQFELNKGLKLPLGVKVTEFSDDGTLSGASDLAVPTERAVKTYVNDFQAATFEPTGFSRGAPNTMGVIEFSLDGTTVYSIDQTSTSTTRTDGKFATGTAWETAATARTLVMYPASGQTSFINWQSGIKYTYTTLQSVTFTAGVQASHFFFFDQGVLGSYSSITGEYIQKLPFVAEVYCDEAANEVVIFGEERHGITMDGATHLYLHGTTGTRYRSGLGIANFVAGATSYTSTAGGVIYDEDIAINIGTQSTNNMLYMVGTAWKILPASNSFAYMVSGKAQYNPKVGGAYQLSDIPAGSYAVMYFMATNCRIHQTMKIMGQYVFTTLAEARESAQSEPRDTVLLGLPSPEFLYVGAVVVDSTGAVQTLDNGAVFVDLRLVNISAGTNSSSAAVIMTAQDSIYDNTGSGLSATNVQLALTELGSEKVDRAGDTITGSLVVSTNTANPSLRITQTGSGNALVVEDSTNPDSTPFVVNTDGNVVIGATTSQFSFPLEIYTTASKGVIFKESSADGAFNTFYFRKSRGTTPTSVDIVANNDGLGGIAFQGTDGVNGLNAASITVAVDGTPGTNDMPGRLMFNTTADGASSPTERMRINNSGNVGIAVTNPLSRLSVKNISTTASETIELVGQRNYTAATYGATSILATSDGTRGTHDLGAIRFEQNPVTGDGHGALLRLFAGGTSSSFATKNEFIRGTAITSSIGIDNIQFRTQDTERMRIDLNGNVGIGAGPDSKLSVFQSATTSTAHFQNTNASWATDVLIDYNASGAGTIAGSLAFSARANGDVWIKSAHATGAMLFLTGGTIERMRIDANGHLLPATSATYDLGSATLRWRNIYTGDLHLSNESKGANDVDGTTGNWTIQEGAEDLYIINNKTGKKYRFALEEIK